MSLKFVVIPCDWPLKARATASDKQQHSQDDGRPSDQGLGAAALMMHSDSSGAYNNFCLLVLVTLSYFGSFFGPRAWKTRPKKTCASPTNLENPQIRSAKYPQKTLNTERLGDSTNSSQPRNSDNSRTQQNCGLQSLLERPACRPQGCLTLRISENQESTTQTSLPQAAAAVMPFPRPYRIVIVLGRSYPSQRLCSL